MAFPDGTGAGNLSYWTQILTQCPNWKLWRLEAYPHSVNPLQTSRTPPSPRKTFIMRVVHCTACRHCIQCNAATSTVQCSSMLCIPLHLWSPAHWHTVETRYFITTLFLHGVVLMWSSIWCGDLGKCVWRQAKYLEKDFSTGVLTSLQRWHLYFEPQGTLYLVSHRSLLHNTWALWWSFATVSLKVVWGTWSMLELSCSCWVSPWKLLHKICEVNYTLNLETYKWHQWG